MPQRGHFPPSCHAGPGRDAQNSGLKDTDPGAHNRTPEHVGLRLGPPPCSCSGCSLGLKAPPAALPGAPGGNGHSGCGQPALPRGQAASLHLRPLLPRRLPSATRVLQKRDSPRCTGQALHWELGLQLWKIPISGVYLFKTDKPSQMSFWDVDGKQIVFKSLCPGAPGWHRG